MLQDCKMLPKPQRDGRYLSLWLLLPGMDTLPSKIPFFHTSPFLCLMIQTMRLVVLPGAAAHGRMGVSG